MSTLPYLDLADPEFSTRSAEVLAARDASWAARTPYGLAVLRYKAVGQILRDRRFRQGSHNWPELHGLTGPFGRFWSNSVIGQEGDAHKALRAIIVPALGPDFIAKMVPAFDEIANDLCKTMAQEPSCEFQSAFATPFAGQAITTLLGLPRSDWPMIGQDASDLGLAMGVNCKAHEPVFDAAYERLRALAEDLVARARRGQDAEGFVAHMVSLFDAQTGVSLDALYDLVVIAIFGGVDTTRSQLGLGMALLVDHPAQWLALRQDESLVPAAVEEFIRTRPTTTWVTRQAIEDVDFEGHEILRGTLLHLLVHASAYDPDVRSTDDFDITRPHKRHFGFGGGAHHCIGHQMARSDIAAALRALRRHFVTIAADGPAAWLPESGNTGPLKLPIRYTCS